MDEKNGYRLQVGEPERKRSLGRPIQKWMDNIGRDLAETVLVGLNLFGVVQERQLESSFERGNETSGSIKCWETIKWLHN
jgi:hypothetical protein